MKMVYAVGGIYMAICAAAIVLREKEPPPGTAFPPVPMPGQTVSEGAQVWYERMKPQCNSVEVETAVAQSPPPKGTQGVSYQAACFALAGKIDRARAIISTLPVRERPHAAEVVFGVAHPVADAGDDQSAGPIMALVVEFSPEHYMALYHAGISEAELGRDAAARVHLTKFLRLYGTDDQWRANAIAALRKVAK